MIIRHAQTSRVAITFDKPLGGSGVRGIDLILCDLDDGEGGTGLGFTYVIGGNGVLVAAAAAELAQRFLAGQPVAHPEATWRRIAASFNRTGGGPYMVGLAALDMALWDLAARRAGQPLGAFMGGEPRSVPVYGSGDFSPGMAPQAAAEVALAQLGRGFRGVKPRVNAVPSDAAMLDAVVAAVGDRGAVMADANEKGDLLRARHLLAVAAERGLAFIEEPLPAHDFLGYRALRGGGAPVATGEHLQGMDRFAVTIADGLAAIIQPDLAMAGGLTPCLAVVRLAEAHGVAVSPHFLPGLFVHLAAASPAVRWLEDFPLIEPYVEGWPELTGGMLAMPATPGHGLTVPAAVRAKSV